jgi:hypothetical protein
MAASQGWVSKHLGVMLVATIMVLTAIRPSWPMPIIVGVCTAAAFVAVDWIQGNLRGRSFIHGVISGFALWLLAETFLR